MSDRGRKLASFTVTVYDDDLPPDCHSHTFDSTWDEVQAAMVVAVGNLQGRLDAPHECPYARNVH